jgi:adenylate cyclase
MRSGPKSDPDIAPRPVRDESLMDLNARLEIMNWLAGAGLSGIAETDLVREFCERTRSAGLELSRGLVFIDTLHPIFEGQGFRWTDVESNESDTFEYGSTSEGEAAETWQRTPFYAMLQTGENEMLIGHDDDRFGMTLKLAGDGHKHFATFVHRFNDSSIIGEMDCVYSLFCMRRPDGFDDTAMSALRDLVPLLGLAVKSSANARIARTLGHVYLGRDAAERVLSGRISRGVADRINAVLWFSDLRGSTAIGESIDPAEFIPFLNDYAGAAIDAIHDEGGDVLKLMGTAFWPFSTMTTWPLQGARRCGRRINSARTSRRSTSGARPKAGRRRPPMWPCMSARCSTAISAASSGSTSPWLVPQSTKSAAWPRCAVRSNASFWCPRRFSTVSARRESGISFRRAAMPCAASDAPRIFTRSIRIRTEGHAASPFEQYLRDENRRGPFSGQCADALKFCRVSHMQHAPENSIRLRSRNWLRTRLTCSGVKPTASAICCCFSGMR